MKSLFCFVLLLLISPMIYAQIDDPGMPVRTVKADQDFEYSIGGTDWQKFVATDIIIETTAMPTRHKWIHVKQLSSNLKFIAPFDDHTDNKPHTCQFTLDLNTIEIERFCEKVFVRWQFRIYEGTEWEQISPVSDPQHVYIIDLVKPRKAVAE